MQQSAIVCLQAWSTRDFEYLQASICDAFQATLRASDVAHKCTWVRKWTHKSALHWTWVYLQCNISWRGCKFAQSWCGRLWYHLFHSGRFLLGRLAVISHRASANICCIRDMLLDSISADWTRKLMTPPRSVSSFASLDSVLLYVMLQELVTSWMQSKRQFYLIYSSQRVRRNHCRIIKEKPKKNMLELADSWAVATINACSAPSTRDAPLADSPTGSDLGFTVVPQISLDGVLLKSSFVS